MDACPTCGRPVLPDVPCRLCAPGGRFEHGVDHQPNGGPPPAAVRRTGPPWRVLGLLAGLCAVIAYVIYAQVDYRHTSDAFYATSTTSTTMATRDAMQPVCADFYVLWSDFATGRAGSDPTYLFQRSKALSDLSSERLAPIELTGATARLALAARDNNGQTFMSAVTEVSDICDANGFPMPSTPAG